MRFLQAFILSAVLVGGCGKCGSCQAQCSGGSCGRSAVTFFVPQACPAGIPNCQCPCSQGGRCTCADSCCTVVIAGVTDCTVDCQGKPMTVNGDACTFRSPPLTVPSHYCITVKGNNGREITLCFDLQANKTINLRCDWAAGKLVQS